MGGGGYKQRAGLAVREEVAFSLLQRKKKRAQNLERIVHFERDHTLKFFSSVTVKEVESWKLKERGI